MKHQTRNMPATLQHKERSGQERDIKPSFYELPPLSLYDIVFQALCKRDIEIVKGIEPFSFQPFPKFKTYVRTIGEIAIKYNGSMDSLSKLLAENSQIGQPARVNEDVLFYDRETTNGGYDRVIVSLRQIFGR